MRIYFPRASRRRVLMWMMVCFMIALLSILRHHRSKTENSILSQLLDDEEDGRILRKLDNSNSTIIPNMQTNTCVIPSNKDLHSTYNVNMGSVTLDELEKKVFAVSYREVLSLVKRTNALLAEQLRAQSRTDEKNVTTENHYFDGDFLKIGSYDYIAGGRWRPSGCHPKWKVAIVIPFRDRNIHLAMLIHNLIPLLQNQNLEFGFFVGEQHNNLVFNRGLMKNVGYQEATRFGDWDCVIFHDADLVPKKGENYYGCDHFPRHFSAYPEQFKYGLAYEDIFGGVVGLTAEQLRQSNGYSNAYWGWGGEDDELSARLRRKGFTISRETEYGYYRSLKHKEKLKSQKCPEVDCLYNNFEMRADWEGINNMTYSRDSLELFPLYTKISVDIHKEDWNSNMPPCQNITDHK